MDVVQIRDVFVEERKVERAALLLKALGHPARLRIVAHLHCQGEKSVGDLGRELDLPQAALSQQLGILRMHGLVTVRRAQGFRFYSLAVPQTAQLLHCIATCSLVTGS
jgi:ArsR family transcriptional regulator